jgi:hypothetical protein
MYENDSNRMLDCLKLLESLYKNQSINHVPFYLILNKQDIFFNELAKDSISVIFPDCPDSLKGKYIQPIIKIPRKYGKSKTKHSLNTDVISNLSDDEFFQIFSFLDYSEVFNVSFVSSLFYKNANSGPIWKFLCEQFDKKIDSKKVNDFVFSFQKEQIYLQRNSCFANPWKYYFIKTKIVIRNHQDFVVGKFQKIFPQIKKIFVSSATSKDMDNVLDQIFEDITNSKE